jgi:hypothetical protein
MACTCGPKEACSKCPPTVNGLHEYQRRVVNELQKRITREAPSLPSGQLKDLALALAAAVDKLNSLSGRSAGFYHQFGQSSGGTAR